VNGFADFGLWTLDFGTFPGIVTESPAAKSEPKSKVQSRVKVEVQSPKSAKFPKSKVLVRRSL